MKSDQRKKRTPLERSLRIRVNTILRPSIRTKSRQSSKPLTPTMHAWETLSANERARCTHSHAATAPYLSNPQARRRHDGYNLHCGHCGHRCDPSYEVSVDGTLAFLCHTCLERGRDTHHRSGRGDAMKLAYGRNRRTPTTR
jgi:hypothetical protein